MNNGTSARKIIDIIDSRSYETGYEEGYRACQLDYRKRAKERKQLKIQQNRRRLYFLKQKVIGAFFLVFTIFAVKALDGDATIALLTVPLGLMLIFGKERRQMDNYYFETKRDERGRQ